MKDRVLYSVNYTLLWHLETELVSSSSPVQRRGMLLDYQAIQSVSLHLRVKCDIVAKNGVVLAEVNFM